MALKFYCTYVTTSLNTIKDVHGRAVQLHVHVKPRVPAANLVRVVQNVAKAVVDDVAEGHVDVLRPELAHARPDERTIIIWYKKIWLSII